MAATASGTPGGYHLTLATVMGPPKRCQHILVNYITLADGTKIGWDCRQCKKRHLYKSWPK